LKHQIETIMKSLAQTKLEKLVKEYESKVELIDKKVNSLLDEIRDYRHDNIEVPDILYSEKIKLYATRQIYIQIIEDLKDIKE